MTYQKAVSILSDVRLNRDYPSKILQAISLCDGATPLIRKYVRTAKPLLTEPMDIDMYTIALAESSLLEAWQFQRTFPEVTEMRPRLLHKILEWCLSRKLLPLSFCLAEVLWLFSSSTTWASRSAAWVPIFELRAIPHSQIRLATSLQSPPIIGAYNTRTCLCPPNPKRPICLCNKARSSICCVNNSGHDIQNAEIHTG
jgi:hypothetical protein